MSKGNTGTSTKQKMNYTQDLREAMQDLRKTIGFSYTNCDIKIDNGLYNDLYGDEVYPLVCLLDNIFNNVCVDIENECFVLADNKQHILIKIPLSVISDINYLQLDIGFNLVFIIEQSYCADILFTNPQ